MSKIRIIVEAGLLSIVTMFLSSADPIAAFTVTPNNNENALLRSILGDGIEIVPGSIEYTGADGASGIFNNGIRAGFNIDSGLILTTGQAIDAVGRNESDSKTTENGSGGDSLLNQLLPEESGLTKDASSLEFKFISEGGDLFFNYVFASEEYAEYVGSEYNDIFGFFLDGTNIALIPNTTTPVGLNTMGYINNDPNDPGPARYNLQYDGFTRTLRASVLDLAPGEHTIRLALADVGDAKYDSAVFIEGGTFSDTPSFIPIPEPSTLPNTIVTGMLIFGVIGGRRLMNKSQRKKRLN